MEPKKILIVDDDLVLSGMVSEILAEDGYSVVVEHDGQAGLAKAEELRPDLVMLDVMMPKMSGLDVLKQIRASDWGAGTQALMLTNVNEPEAMGATIEQGGHVQYLLKTDWSIEDIVKKIKQTLGDEPVV